ncbi:MAG: response regulator transcription factor [Acidimicrobiia bacterium]
MSATILVVDDVTETQLLLRSTLIADNHVVHVAGSGEAAIEAIASKRLMPDVVVLDIMLPGIDGFATCRKLRELSDAYILMLTSRSDEADRVIGLELGADDYLAKPFSPRELAARVRAVLRRPRAPRASAPRVFSQLRVEPLARRVEVAGLEVDLTRREFDLLDVLTQSPDRVYTRTELITAVWGDSASTDEHALDVHLSNLRKKLHNSKHDRSVIETVRGVGFRFRA